MEQKINQIKAGVALSYISLIVGNIIVLLYTPVMLRLLGASEYGIYSLCNTISSTIAMMDAGMGIAAVRYIVRDKGNPEKQASTMGMFLIFNVILGIIAFLLMETIIFKADAIFGDSMTASEIHSIKVIITITSVYLLLSFCFAVFQAAVTAYERFVFIKILDIAKSIALPLLILPFLFTGHKAIAMSTITVTIFSAILIIKFLYCLFYLKLKVNFNKIDMSLVKEAIPFALVIFSKLILERLFWTEGQFILGYTSGSVAVAMIALAVQLKGYVESISLSVNNLFLPRCSEYATMNNGLSLASDLFVKVTRLQTIIMGLVISGYIVFGKDFVRLWAGEEYADAFWASLLIIVPCTITFVQGMGNAILQAFGKVRFQSLVYFIIVVYVAVLTFIFGYQYGTIGCAAIMATAVIGFEVIVMNAYYYKIGIDIKKIWGNMLKILLCFFPITLIFLFGIYFRPIYGWGTLIVGIVLFSLISLLLILKFVINEYERQLLIYIKTKVKNALYYSKLGL